MQAGLLAPVALQRDCLAQAFAQAAHVPDTAIAVALAVAAGAAHVAVTCQTRIAGVVEELLAAFQLGRHPFGALQRTGGRGGRDGPGLVIGQRADVEEADGTRHHVADGRLLAIGRDRDALGRALHVQPAHFGTGGGIEDADLARGFQRHQHVSAVRRIGGGTGLAAVVHVVAPCGPFGWRGSLQVQVGHDGAHGALEVQRLAVAALATLDVVLLGGNPGRAAIRRDGGSAQVVGQAASLDGRVFQRADRQRDRALQRGTGGVDQQDFATPEAGTAGAGREGAFAGQGRRDEAAGQQALAVGGDGQVTDLGAQCHALLELAGDGVELQQLLRAQRADPDTAAIGSHHHAVGLGSHAQRNAGGHGHRGRIDDADAAAVAVGHPDLACIVDGQRAWTVLGGWLFRGGFGPSGDGQRDLAQQCPRLAVQHAHAVLVGVDDPDAWRVLPVIGNGRGALRQAQTGRAGGCRRTSHLAQDAHDGGRGLLRLGIGVVAGQVGRRDADRGIRSAASRVAGSIPGARGTVRPAGRTVLVAVACAALGAVATRCVAARHIALATVVAAGAVLAAGSVVPLRALVVGARGYGGRDGCHGLGIGGGVHGATTATTTAGGEGTADHQGHEAARQRLGSVRP